MPLISQFHNHAQNVQAVVLAGHTRPVNSTDCMIEGKYYLKRIIIDIFILYFKKYFHSFIQSAVFTGRVALQNNDLYVLRMKLANYNDYRLVFTVLASTWC